jgi:hypothetical protein
MRTVLRLQNKFEALGARVMRSFEATQEHRHEGHGSVIAWAKTHQHVKGPEVARLRRTTHRLRDLPRTERALADGLITSEHVEFLHRAYRILGPRDFALLEEVFVDSAIDLRFVDFEQTVANTIVRIAPADANEQDRRDAEDRYASSSPLGRNGKVDGQFESTGFPIWQAELERLMDLLLEQDRAEAKDRLGRAPLHSELSRTTRQRRVDAMVLMARRSAAHGDEELGPRPYTTVVHVNPEFLTALIAVLTKALNPDEDPGFDLDQALDDIELTEDSLHELDDGTPVTIDTIVFALLTGTIRGIFYDADGEILRYGRGRRIYSGGQSGAIRAQLRRCAHLWGCDRTGPATQTDHTTEFQDGGLTDVDNGTRYCGPHNIWKTNHRFDPPPTGAPPPDRAQRRTPRRPGRATRIDPPDERAAEPPEVRRACG